MSEETGVPRGARMLVGDEALLAMIRDVIRETPFAGEGHRKVTAHLRREREVSKPRKRLGHGFAGYAEPPHDRREAQAKLPEV